jgi:hypothetical protein
MTAAEHDTIPSASAPIYNRYASWLTWILPHLEQEARFATMRQTHDPSGPPGDVVLEYLCPTEPRRNFVYGTGNNERAVTHYAGVAGTSVNAAWPSADGVLYNRSKVKLTDITDGASNTLMVGERPPSPNLDWGWWDTAITPSQATRDMDVVLGVAEIGGTAGPSGPRYYDEESIRDAPCVVVSVYTGVGIWPCVDPPGTQTPSNFCDFFHFWSNHYGGAFFCFADGSVRFIPYSAASEMKALSTRAGGDTISEDF